MQVVVGDEQLNIDFRGPSVGHIPGYLAIGEKAGTEQPSWDDYVDLLMQQWYQLLDSSSSADEHLVHEFLERHPSDHRGSRKIEHIGTAHDDAELELWRQSRGSVWPPGRRGWAWASTTKPSWSGREAPPSDRAAVLTALALVHTYAWPAERASKLVTNTQRLQRANMPRGAPVRRPPRVCCLF